MIRAAWTMTDEEFESLRVPLTARVQELDAPAMRVVLLMLVGSCPEELNRLINLYEGVRGLPALAAAESIRAGVPS